MQEFWDALGFKVKMEIGFLDYLGFGFLMDIGGWDL